MTNKLSLKTIIAHAFKLFTESYLDILPFVLLHVFCVHLISKHLPVYVPLSAGLELISTIFFFSCILYAVDRRYRDMACNYADIFTRGLKRFFSTLCAILLMLSPALFIGWLLNIVIKYTSSSEIQSSHLMTMGATFILLLLFILLIMWMILMLYFYVSWYKIVVKNTTAWQGLKQSWQLIKGHWFKTFGLLFFLILIVIILQATLFIFIPKFDSEIVRLFSMPFSAALMIIYEDALSRYKDAT